ncbi:DUF2931 family protein [Frateuria sp. Soil773]|uniref:DUF2931 family protein n=1 Tax=Frateuria sp. Soil773 TaxID=1736407 RepID=UPI0019109F19|nr:DUF2931 family protein [Frateuria sp. Soil773]
MRLPYPAWKIGFFAPYNMEVWTEAVSVEDMSGHLFSGMEPGVVSMAYPRDSAAWPKSIPIGKGREVTGAALPKRVYVRWQSLVEPQTYSVVLEIPERARRLMLGPPVRDMPGAGPDGDKYYYNDLSIGLAPGGIVRVWVNGIARRPQPVLCVKAQVEPKGPDQGRYGGRYVTLPAESQAYLRHHSIPYGSWGC